VRVATGVMLVIAFLAGAAVIAGLWLDTRESADARCWTDETPVGVEVSETALVSAESTAWPVGRRCEWRSASRDGVIVTQTGWPRTIALLVVGGCSIPLAIVGILRRRLATLAPLAVCVVAFGSAAFWAG
jgi:hypothetical protein